MFDSELEEIPEIGISEYVDASSEFIVALESVLNRDILEHRNEDLQQNAIVFHVRVIEISSHFYGKYHDLCRSIDIAIIEFIVWQQKRD